MCMEANSQASMRGLPQQRALMLTWPAIWRPLVVGRLHPLVLPLDRVLAQRRAQRGADGSTGRRQMGVAQRPDGHLGALGPGKVRLPGRGVKAARGVAARRRRRRALPAAALISTPLVGSGVIGLTASVLKLFIVAVCCLRVQRLRAAARIRAVVRNTVGAGAAVARCRCFCFVLFLFFLLAAATAFLGALLLLGRNCCSLCAGGGCRVCRAARFLVLPSCSGLLRLPFTLLLCR